MAKKYFAGRMKSKSFIAGREYSESMHCARSFFLLLFPDEDILVGLLKHFSMHSASRLR